MTKKKKELEPNTLPPECPPATPGIIPSPERELPDPPLPEKPVEPEPKIYPGKENAGAGCAEKIR